MADAPAPDADAPVADAPKKKNKLVLLLPVVALVLGGGGGFYQYQKATAATLPEDEAAETAEPIEYGQFTKLPGIIVNPAGSAGRRYLMVDLALETADEKALEEIALREVVIRDAAVRILSERTVEELTSVALRPALKDTLRTTVNGILDGKIDRLYFTQYVLQ